MNVERGGYCSGVEDRRFGGGGDGDVCSVWRFLRPRVWIDLIDYTLDCIMGEKMPLG